MADVYELFRDSEARDFICESVSVSSDPFLGVCDCCGEEDTVQYSLDHVLCDSCRDKILGISEDFSEMLDSNTITEDDIVDTISEGYLVPDYKKLLKDVETKYNGKLLDLVKDYGLGSAKNWDDRIAAGKIFIPDKYFKNSGKINTFLKDYDCKFATDRALQKADSELTPDVDGTVYTPVKASKKDIQDNIDLWNKEGHKIDTADDKGRVFSNNILSPKVSKTNTSGNVTSNSAKNTKPVQPNKVIPAKQNTPVAPVTTKKSNTSSSSTSNLPGVSTNKSTSKGIEGTLSSFKFYVGGLTFSADFIPGKNSYSVSGGWLDSDKLVSYTKGVGNGKPDEDLVYTLLFGVSEYLPTIDYFSKKDPGSRQYSTEDSMFGVDYDIILSFDKVGFPLGSNSVNLMANSSIGGDLIVLSGTDLQSEFKIERDVKQYLISKAEDAVGVGNTVLKFNSSFGKVEASLINFDSKSATYEYFLRGDYKTKIVPLSKNVREDIEVFINADAISMVLDSLRSDYKVESEKNDTYTLTSIKDKNEVLSISFEFKDAGTGSKLTMIVSLYGFKDSTSSRIVILKLNPSWIVSQVSRVAGVLYSEDLSGNDFSFLKSSVLKKYSTASGKRVMQERFGEAFTRYLLYKYGTLNDSYGIHLSDQDISKLDILVDVKVKDAVAERYCSAYGVTVSIGKGRTSYDSDELKKVFDPVMKQLECKAGKISRDRVIYIVGNVKDFLNTTDLYLVESKKL